VRWRERGWHAIEDVQERGVLDGRADHARQDAALAHVRPEAMVDCRTLPGVGSEPATAARYGVVSAPEAHNGCNRRGGRYPVPATVAALAGLERLAGRQPVDAETGDNDGAEVARLAARLDRLERQFAEMVKRFSGRLAEHERRLDKLDVPPERAWLRPDDGAE
jgi:hypothetical protein